MDHYNLKSYEHSTCTTNVIIFIMENSFIIYNFYFFRMVCFNKKNISQYVILETVSLEATKCSPTLAPSQTPPSPPPSPPLPRSTTLQPRSVVSSPPRACVRAAAPPPSPPTSATPGAPAPPPPASPPHPCLGARARLGRRRRPNCVPPPAPPSRPGVPCRQVRHHHLQRRGQTPTPPRRPSTGGLPFRAPCRMPSPTAHHSCRLGVTPPPPRETLWPPLSGPTLLGPWEAARERLLWRRRTTGPPPERRYMLRRDCRT